MTERVLGGRYRLVERLGLGGMGEVFRAIDESSGESLALKRLNVPERHDPDAQALRFRREFHTMAGLRHPRIVTVHDYGVDEDGAPFYTMELLDGRDLRELGKVSAPEAARLLRDVTSALAYLHARRLLHRDVAARNVRETSDGRVKLFDFGVLATPGLTADVAGTPPHVAPENIWRLPLDARADLFGLGGLAYWMLTGVHAYPARTLAELPEVWRRRPPPPSALEPSVPEALDRLVMSLLSLDPIGRPGTAAEVIDRLNAAGGLEPEADVESARGWLASAALVGRAAEMTQLERRLKRALGGRGRALLIEAPSGTGKSRLLRELGLNAQVAGAAVVHASGDAAERGPYGLYRELARQVRTALPEEAAAAAAGRQETLARLAPEALVRTSRTSAPADGYDPAAERLRAQEDLAGWVLDIAKAHPLVLLVDDVQRADEASGAVLATLAWQSRKHRLLLAATLRTDEPVRAVAANAAIRDAAAVLSLGGLAPRDVEALVGATFGQTPNAAALATFLHAAAGGHPLRTTELLRHLVERGVVRYADGQWSIADRLSTEGLPAGLVEALDARVASLPADVRALGQALAVLGGEVPLATAIALADQPSVGDAFDESHVFAALDVLVYEEILAASAGSHRFRHDGLREALLRSIEPDRRRALHRRAAEVLLREPSPERELETGWHLHHGDERARGAAFLEAAGRRLFDAQSFADAIRPLEAALEVLEQEGAPPVRTLDLRRLLVVAGTMSDRDVVLRHAPDTIEQLRHHAGALVAEKAARLLGARLGLLVGVAIAWVRSWLTADEHKGPHPPDALAHLFAAAAYVASAWSLSFEPEKIGSLLAIVRPVAAFEKRVPYAAYLLLHCFQALSFGRWRSVIDDGARALGILESDFLTPMPTVDRQNGRGAVHYMAASAYVIDQDPAYVASLASLDSLDLRFFDVSTVMARLFWHRLRGEEERARELESEAERRSLSLGAVWVLESQSTWMSYVAYSFTRDVAGLKRCIEAMERLCTRGYRLEPFVLAARADYHRERGELRDAERSARKALERLPADDGLRRLAAYAALAETQVALADAGAARESARAGLEIAVDRVRAMVSFRVRLERALALAEALDGDHAGADRRLATTLDWMQSRESPVLLGAVAEARARVALLRDDLVAFEVHRAETDRWFRPTRNPTLIARADRLDDLRIKTTEGDRASRLLAADAVTARAALPARSWIVATLRALEGTARASRALELLLTASSAARGWLFRVHDGDLRLVASSGSPETPEAIAAALRRVATAATDSERTMDEMISSSGEAPWLPVVLAVRDGDDLRVVAAAALVGGSLPLVHPDTRDVAEIARQLDEPPEADGTDQDAVG